MKPKPFGRFNMSFVDQKITETEKQLELWYFVRCLIKAIRLHNKATRKAKQR